MLRRILFYITSFLFSFIYAYIAVIDSASVSEIAMMCFFSLLVLFPRRTEPINSTMSIITGLIWCYFGPWPLAIAWTALQRFLLAFAENPKQLRWDLFSSPILLLIVMNMVHQNYPLSEISVLFWGVIAAMTFFGLKGRRFLLNLLAQRRQLSLKNKQADRSVLPDSTNVSQLQTIIIDYQQRFTQLNRQKPQLSDNIQPHIELICRQGLLIIDHMQNNEQDVERANKFLTRYLAAVEKIVAQMLKSKEQKNLSTTMQQTLHEGEVLIADMSSAFTELQRRLLDNDQQQLSVEIKLIDKLLKMEGFK